MDWALAFVIGLGTSLVELLSRYRDEPLKVIATSQFAWVYLLLNGLLALGAHGILLDSGLTEIETLTQRAALGVAAGLGAAVVLRSRVFTARLGDEQISIGPGYVVDQLLGIIDAQIDRRRALQRVQIVVEVMDRKDFDGSRIHASTMITGSRQNLSLQEQKDLANQIREVVDRKIPDQEKAYALGFILLDFMGEEFLKTVAIKLPTLEELAVGGSPSFAGTGITETGTGVVAPRNWGASLPVQRAKVVRESLTDLPLEPVRQRIVTLLDSGQFGTNEDERMMLRQQIAEILNRPGASEEDQVFALGFAVHAIVDSTRFQEAFEDLPRKPHSRRAADQDPNRETDEDIDVDLSAADRPITGSHPTISIKAGPLPAAKD